jgi:hypothetical protein
MIPCQLIQTEGRWEVVYRGSKTFVELEIPCYMIRNSGWSFNKRGLQPGMHLKPGMDSASNLFVR